MKFIKYIENFLKFPQQQNIEKNPLDFDFLLVYCGISTCFLVYFWSISSSKLHFL